MGRNSYFLETEIENSEGEFIVTTNACLTGHETYDPEKKAFCPLWDCVTSLMDSEEKGGILELIDINNYYAREDQIKPAHDFMAEQWEKA